MDEEAQPKVAQVPRIWVVVADSEQARFFEAESCVGTLRELGGMKQQTRSEDRIKHFAREVANRLDLEGQQGAFDRLVIAADPTFLPTLRAYLSSRVRELVAEELSKDLVQDSADQVRRNLPIHL